MSDVGTLLWLIPGLPLLAAVVIVAAGATTLRRYSHWPTILSTAASCAVAVLVLVGLATSSGETRDLVSEFQWPWFVVGSFQVSWSLQADTLSATMLIAITFVGTCIAIFSAYYMEGEAGYPRYFAVMSLFLFSMTGLVLADNFLVLYAFWEGVGLCSYLLIGFWFQKPAAAAAARKAFLVTRLGDAGFILGIMVLWAQYGSFDFSAVFLKAARDPEGVTLACLLLLCGAVGKSAQFPLHVWLPDAMEGPTPVSALIHAATMVTAGVYLLARCTPLFVLAPAAQITIACLGGFTALLAALIAITQQDLKKVLAYSTVSQLGYMFLGLGAGLRNGGLVIIAVSAAIFHLFTHAFFKGLLFLAAGSVMRSMGHVIDMRRFSGLRKVLPITRWTFLCGALALAGLVPFSGFWSKDAILEAVLQAGESSTSYGTVYLTLFALGLVVAALTAFYTFRAYFKTFFGEERIPEEAFHHGHHHEHARDDGAPHHDLTPDFEKSFAMKLPLIVLAIGAVFAGTLLGVRHGITDFLAKSQAFVTTGTGAEQHWNWWLIIVSTIAAAGGIGAAVWMYYRKPGFGDQVADAVPKLEQASYNRFYFDEIYQALIVKPMGAIATLARFVDSVIDGIVDLIGQTPRFFARFLQGIQNGLVQFYALVMVVFVTAFLAIFVLWSR